MGRGMNAEQIKLVMDALRKKPMRFSELKSLRFHPKKGKPPRTIPNQSLVRILKEYLLYWGLVEQDERKRWVWKEHFRKFSSEVEYTRHLAHSRKLSSALGAVLDQYVMSTKNSKETSKYKQFCEQHFETGYPDVYGRLVELRKLQSKLEQLEMTIGGQEWRKQKESGIVSVSAGNDPATRATRREYDACRETHSKLLEVYKELLGEIEFIRMRIEAGHALDGKCQLCPDFIIAQSR